MADFDKVTKRTSTPVVQTGPGFDPENPRVIVSQCLEGWYAHEWRGIEDTCRRTWKGPLRTKRTEAALDAAGRVVGCCA